MTLQNLLEIGQLKKHETTAEEIRLLLAAAQITAVFSEVNLLQEFFQ